MKMVIHFIISSDNIFFSLLVIKSVLMQCLLSKVITQLISKEYILETYLF